MNFNWHPVVLGACLGLLLAIFVRSCGGAEATVFWECAACPSIRGYAVFVRGDTGTVRHDTVERLIAATGQRFFRVKGDLLQ